MIEKPLPQVGPLRASLVPKTLFFVSPHVTYTRPLSPSTSAGYEEYYDSNDHDSSGYEEEPSPPSAIRHARNPFPKLSHTNPNKHDVFDQSSYSGYGNATYPFTHGTTNPIELTEPRPVSRDEEVHAYIDILDKSF